MINRPDVVKSAATAALSAITTWLLLKLMARISHPTAVDPASLSAWWGDVGTPSASALISGAAGVIIGGYLTALGILGTILGAAGMAKKIPRLDAVWEVVSIGSMRRILAAGLVTIYVTGTVAASATDQSPSLVLVDLGPVEEAAPTSTSTAATNDRIDVVVDDSTPSAAAPVADTWIVAPGDHLWHIAERVLQTSGSSPSISSVNRYWRRLIAENLPTIGSDPDLIFPGQVLQLPPL